MKVRSQIEFVDYLDMDFAWRIKDISSLLVAISSSSGSAEALHIRSGTALAYAHWEGFVKNSSTAYLYYILSKRMIYREVKPCFVFFGIKSHLIKIGSTKKFLVSEIPMDKILNILDEKMKFNPEEYIYTGSNLNSEIFSNLISSLGIDHSIFETKFHFIDEILLARRNKVAHGEYLLITKGECISALRELESLLRLYKNVICNAGVLEEFRI